MVESYYQSGPPVEYPVDVVLYSDLSLPPLSAGRLLSFQIHSLGSSVDHSGCRSDV